MTYDPAFYEAVHRGNPGDLEPYRRLAANARSILELGCGYGRVLAALARPGLELWGVDANPDMLARAARLAPSAKLICADITGIDLGRTFDRIFAPFSTLYCLPDAMALRDALARIKGHLAPSGAFAFDVWDAEALHNDPEAEEGEDALEPILSVVIDGREWEVLEQSHFRRASRSVEVTYVHRPRDGGADVVGTIHHRYFLRAEIDTACAALGLSLSDPIALDDSDSLVFVACHAEGP